jgi:hypothetical protein
VKRTTIFLDDQTLRRLQQTARRRGVSSASMIREAVAMYLETPDVQTPLPSIVGQFASTESDTSAKVDELLWRNPHE